MTNYQLAQINVAHMKYAATAIEMADFMNNLDRINQLAESSPGFQWRLKMDIDAPEILDVFGPGILVNMSTWQDISSLHNYVFKTDHLQIMRRRREWFSHPGTPTSVLWWVPASTQPSLTMAKQRLEHLGVHGPSTRAFTFRKAYPPPPFQNTGLSGFPDLCPAN